jgi:hypothetical protein
MKDPPCREDFAGAHSAGAWGPEWASTSLDGEGLNFLVLDWHPARFTAPAAFHDPGGTVCDRLSPPRRIQAAESIASPSPAG